MIYGFAMKIKLVLGMILAVFIFSGCNMPQIGKLDVTSTPRMAEKTNEITISEDGFSPKDSVVSIGETVTFKNLDSSPHTVASDPHPAHDQLIDLYSTPIFKTQSYKYVFTKRGDFGFHLEDNPSISGKIVVE